MSPLAFRRRPAPAQDELLTSYLVRLADSLGVSSHRLGAQLGDRFEIWTRDIDRSASGKMLAALAGFCDMSHEAVHGMTLQAWEATLSATGCRQGVAPWVNSVGVYHRIRKLHGLQYCPKCLSEAPVFKRRWRLSFVTVCAEHRVALRDACPHCDAPIVPHRSRQAGSRCHGCGRNLCAPSPAMRSDLGECAELQRHFLEVGVLPTALIRYGAISAAEFFDGASQVLQVAKVKLARAAGDGQGDSARFELMRTERRAKYAAVLFHLLSDWPHRFMEFADEHSLSQTCFAQYSSMPPWIAEVVRELPPRIRERKKRRSSMPPMLHKAFKGEGWRTVRAGTLLRATGVKL